MSRSMEPVACSLEPGQAESQLLEWVDLQPLARAVERLPTGARMEFLAELGPRIEDLARRESQCCRFLAITVTQSDRGVVLEVLSDNPQALPIIDRLAGLSGR